METPLDNGDEVIHAVCCEGLNSDKDEVYLADYGLSLRRIGKVGYKKSGYTSPPKVISAQLIPKHLI